MKDYLLSVTPSISSPPIQAPSDTPEAALARYLATVSARAAQKREVIRKLEDAKIQAAQKRGRQFWWLKD